MAGANDVAMNAQAVATEKMLGRPTISRFHAMFSVGGIAGASAGAWIAGRGVAASAHLVWAALLLAGFAMASTPLLVDMHDAVGGGARGPPESAADSGGAAGAVRDRLLHLPLGRRDCRLDGRLSQADTGRGAGTGAGGLRGLLGGDGGVPFVAATRSR